MSGLSFGVDVATKQTTGTAMNMACSSSPPLPVGLDVSPAHVLRHWNHPRGRWGSLCGRHRQDLQCHQSTGQSEDKVTDGLVEGLPLCRKYLLERLIT